MSRLVIGRLSSEQLRASYDFLSDSLSRMPHLSQRTSSTALWYRATLTVLCSVVKLLGSGLSTQEVGRNTRRSQVFHSTLFFFALAASCGFDNKTEHSQGFSIW